MNNQTYRTDLTDRQWQIIKDLLPPPKSGGRPRTICLRQAFNAMLYLLTTGCQWKMLPRGYPHWRTVYGYFRDWQKDGTWERLHHRLRRWARRQERRRPRPTAGSLDSQSIKSTAVAGVRGFESFKRVRGRKRHIIVDTLGFLLAVCITPANVSDQRFRYRRSRAGLALAPPVRASLTSHLVRRWLLCNGLRAGAEFGFETRACVAPARTQGIYAFA